MDKPVTAGQARPRLALGVLLLLVSTMAFGDEKTRENVGSMKLTIGNTVLEATLVDNSTTKALRDLLSKGPVTINMIDYGNMEKVGPLLQSLPRNDEPITTEAGDLILYQGNSFVIYYAPNTWSLTRVGKLNGVTAQSLKKLLGNGNVIVTLSHN